MNSLVQNDPLLFKMDISDDELVVYLKDGRVLHVPLIWYPSLERASVEQRKNYQILGDGEGLYWPDLDEDLSVKGFFQGISLQNRVA